MAARVIAFDVNETLLNIHHLEGHFQRIFGESAVLKEWFSLILLNSEAVTLAGAYFDFSTLGGAALEMLANSRNISLDPADKDQVLQGMLSLPPHPDVIPSLELLQNAGLRLVTLTNSSQDAVEAQLRNARLSRFFERNFSVDAVRRFKPAPEPYRMLAAELRILPEQLRLVAVHSWDVMGAMQAGCAAAFVARPGKVLFPLMPAPDIVGPDLTAVADAILSAELSPSHS